MNENLGQIAFETYVAARPAVGERPKSWVELSVTQQAAWKAAAAAVAKVVFRDMEPPF